MDVVRLAEETGEPLAVRRVFGEAYEREGVTVVLVAIVRGGGGGGGGERDGEEQEGEGGGFGVSAKPAGAYVISEGRSAGFPPSTSTGSSRVGSCWGWRRSCC